MRGVVTSDPISMCLLNNYRYDHMNCLFTCLVIQMDSPCSRVLQSDKESYHARILYFPAISAIAMVFFYDAETYRGLTSPAPSSLIYPAQWHSFVKNTKVLYFRQQYKRCINESEMMLQEEAGRVTHTPFFPSGAPTESYSCYLYMRHSYTST